MKTRFIFIRHAQSVAKELGIVQGDGASTPLSALGKEQAEKLGNSFKSEKCDRLFASTSVRAVETAAQIKKFHAPVLYEEIRELHERSKGEAEGMKQEEFEKKYPEVLEAWGREEDPRPAGGESFEDVEKRVMPIIERHLKEYAGQTLAYVIHGNVIRVILGAMLGIPPAKRNRLVQDYCAVNIAEFDTAKGRWKIIASNRDVIS